MKLDFLRIFDNPLSKYLFPKGFHSSHILILTRWYSSELFRFIFPKIVWYIRFHECICFISSLLPKIITVLKYIIAINFKIYLQSASINSAVADRRKKRGRGRSTKIIISQKQKKLCYKKRFSQNLLF